MFLFVWASAVVTALLGTLPGRSFRFRAVAAGSFVTVSALVAEYVPEFWIRPFFETHEPPEGFTWGEWAVLGLYLIFFFKTMVWVCTIALAYWLRLSLLPTGEKDTGNHKFLVAASVVVLLLIPLGLLVLSQWPLL